MSVQKAVYYDVWPSCCSTCQWCLVPGIRLLHKAMAVALLARLLALISCSGPPERTDGCSLGMGALVEPVRPQHTPLQSPPRAVAPQLSDGRPQHASAES